VAAYGTRHSDTTARMEKESSKILGRMSPESADDSVPGTVYLT
jgi:hypothetical protein